MTDTECVAHEKNVATLYTVEGFASRHDMSARAAFDLLMKYQVVDAIKRCYPALHTQDMDENVDFAEDNLHAKQEMERLAA
jgi:hypothetical protein